jgi:hypothetical protein
VNFLTILPFSTAFSGTAISNYMLTSKHFHN